MPLWRPSISVVFRLLAGPLLLLAHGGCTSALTTAAMREALRDAVDSVAAVAERDASASDRDAKASADLAAEEPAPLISEPKPPSLDESVNQAVARLKSIGELDAQTQATLLSILEKTSPEDWPAAIDAFAASLEAYRPASRTPAPAAAKPAGAKVADAKPAARGTRAESAAALVFPESAPPRDRGHDSPAEPSSAAVVVEPPAKAAVEPQGDVPLVFPGMPTTPEPARLAVVGVVAPSGGTGLGASAEGGPVFAAGTTAQPGVAEEWITFPEQPAIQPARGESRMVTAPPKPLEPPVASEIPVASETPAVVEQPAVVPAKPAPPALAVRNASFVSRVRAWGVVEKFPEAAFRPGQEVIVYFELDALTARESLSGHTSSVATIFRLVDSAGRQVGQWDFAPIDETASTAPREYFARYFIRIPDTAAAGPHRLEMKITDLVAGVSSHADLEVTVRP